MYRTPDLPPPGRSQDPGILRDCLVVMWLGAKVKNVVGMGEVSTAGLPSEIGVLIVEAPQDSVAAKAGLHAGDVLLKWNDKPVSTITDLPPAAQHGKEIRLDVWRNQEHHPLNMSLPGSS